MESSSLLLVCSGIAALVVILCCFCYCCCRKSTEKITRRGTSYRRIPTSLVESTDDFELTQTHVEDNAALYSGQETGNCDDPSSGNDYVNSDVSPFFKQDRPVIPLPDNFHHFITTSIIPSFNKQRSSGYQFAVLLLLSEKDLVNLTQMTFSPCNSLGQPFLNRDYSTMPQYVSRYGNYIVARPRDNSCHSEEEIFGKYSSIDSPFDNLWNTYFERNHSFPKCILLYTWNLPCSRCTDVIIRSLEERQYHRTSVIVAHTIYWRSEIELEHSRNRDKLINGNISVEQVKYSPFLSPA